jgi:PP-loop superfamily ATP-utilizing enzyme
VVAFGGGVASTLAAYLAHAVFESESVAVFVRLPGTTDEDVIRVECLAAFIGEVACVAPTCLLRKVGQSAMTKAKQRDVRCIGYRTSCLCVRL